MSERKLLIVEDDPGLAKQMKWCFEDESVTLAGDESQAVEAFDRLKPAVVTLDLGLPPDPGGATVGMALLRYMLERKPMTKVIVITGREEQEFAISAISSGAWDYYQKPIDQQTLQFVVDRAFRIHALELERERLKASLADSPIAGILTKAPNMLALCRQIERVAPTDANVLIQGETGTGKELVARAIHGLSTRASEPLTTINCAAIPEALLESELFGHEKGAFTGAASRKIGKIEAAAGGTLFLDEIGDMALPLQAKILRFLQERNFERLGSNTPIEVDTRVVAATHQPLKDMVASGEFREDLFFRLSEIELLLPPLRERPGDPVLLAHALLERHSQGRSLKFSAAAQSAMSVASWPGNVRELENRVKRACIMVEGSLIEPIDLELAEAPDGVFAGAAATVVSVRPLKDVRTEAETAAIRAALAAAEDNISQAARLLDVSRPTLYSLMKKYDIETET